jgi:predicted polyphosphate/ATP-dependent NAD kinase
VQAGFIVNPVAGLGGPAALKGSDGTAAAQALAAGWAPQSAARAAMAVAGLSGIDWLAAGGAMGADMLAVAGQPHRVLWSPEGATDGKSTAAAARAMAAAGAELIIFAGGDGTARDLLGVGVPVLGVPAGVKMHSGVFATSPAAARALLAGLRPGFACDAAEIIDRDAAGHMHLYGTLPSPRGPQRQPAKAGGQGGDALLAGAIAGLARELAAEPLVVIGPGATMLALKQAMAGAGTLLGCDVFAHGRVITADADARVLAALPAEGTRLVLGVIGGQGFLIGRGNQMIPPALLARAAITVVAGANKLALLPGGRLLADSGDAALDARLAGPLPVITGRRRRMMMMLEPA